MKETCSPMLLGFGLDGCLERDCSELGVFQKAEGEEGHGVGGGSGDVQKAVQAVVITDTSSAEPPCTGPHCMWAMGGHKAAPKSKVGFFKHKFSRHTAPIWMGQTGNLNDPLQPSRVRGGG